MSITVYLISVPVTLLLLILTIYLIGKTPTGPKYKVKQMTVGELCIFILLIGIPIINAVICIYLCSVILICTADILKVNIPKIMNKKLFK